MPAYTVAPTRSKYDQPVSWHGLCTDRSFFKCSGTHPICTRCTARSLVSTLNVSNSIAADSLATQACSWDVPEEGITKTQHLQHKLAEQSARLDQVNAMVHILRHGTDKVATEALARLRIGETVDEVLQLVGTQDLSMSLPDQMQPGQMEPGPGSWSSNEPAYDPMLVPPNHYAAARERVSA